MQVGVHEVVRFCILLFSSPVFGSWEVAEIEWENKNPSLSWGSFVANGMCRYTFSQTYHPGEVKLNVTFDKFLTSFDDYDVWQRLDFRPGIWYFSQSMSWINPAIEEIIMFSVKWSVFKGRERPNGFCICNAGLSSVRAAAEAAATTETSTTSTTPTTSTTASTMTTASTSTTVTTTQSTAASTSIAVSPTIGRQDPHPKGCTVQATHTHVWTHEMYITREKCTFDFDLTYHVPRGTLKVNVTFDKQIENFDDFGLLTRMKSHAGIWYYGRSKWILNPGAPYDYEFNVEWREGDVPMATCYVDFGSHCRLNSDTSTISTTTLTTTTTTPTTTTTTPTTTTTTPTTTTTTPTTTTTTPTTTPTTTTTTPTTTTTTPTTTTTTPTTTATTPTTTATTPTTTATTPTTTTTTPTTTTTTPTTTTTTPTTTTTTPTTTTTTPTTTTTTPTTTTTTPTTTTTTPTTTTTTPTTTTTTPTTTTTTPTTTTTTPTTTTTTPTTTTTTPITTTTTPTTTTTTPTTTTTTPTTTTTTPTTTTTTPTTTTTTPTTTTTTPTTTTTTPTTTTTTPTTTTTTPTTTTTTPTTTTTTPTTTTTTPTSTTPGFPTFRYTNVIDLSMDFYAAQRSGALPDNRIPWRGDSALGDSGTKGEDLTGGYYDAGDHVKFNLPMAASMTLLAYGQYIFADAYEDFSLDAEMRETIKWGLDYFLKCWRPSDSNPEYYAQVANAYADHAFWGRAEEMAMPRPAYKVTLESYGSDVSAETASAFAAGYLVFKDTDPDYAARLLDAAKSLYKYADDYRGIYSDAIFNAQGFYPSAGYNDELMLGAIMLYTATGDETYKTKAMSFFSATESSPWALSWGDKNVLAQLLLYNITRDDMYKGPVQDFLMRYRGDVPSVVTFVDGVLAFRSEWAPNRYAANAAFVAVLAAEVGIDPDRNVKWAQTQIDYLLGNNKDSFSYVIGFGSNYPLKPRHRGSSCPDLPADCDNDELASPLPNPQILYGALVGGPQANGVFVDDRNNFRGSEVACDYNAGFTSALAGLTHFRSMLV